MATIEKILCSAPRGVLSFVGAGGKTSLMFHLAALLVLSGQRVLTTTTTRIFVPTPDQSETVLVDSDPHSVLRLASSCMAPSSRDKCVNEIFSSNNPQKNSSHALKSSGHVTVASAHLPDSGKLKGFDPEDINLFAGSGLFDWVLVEADGAAGRPLKAPAEHEPPVPPISTVLVAVVGLDVLGKPLSEDFVFRSPRAGELMGLSEGETITESALLRLFAHPRGPFKFAPAASRRFIFLNKADNPELIAAGKRLAGQLRNSGGAPAEALIIGQALDRIRVHSVNSLVISK